MAQKTIRKVVRKPKGDSLQALHTLRADLNAVLVERGREVDGLLLALLAREHVFLLGPPGVAKSMAVELLASAIDGAACFNILMTRFTLPEEMFGPMAISGLKHDRFERVTKGFLPEANFAFVDEALALDTPLLTHERGWQTVETVQVGDYVYGSNGAPTKVVRKTDVKIDGDCYRVTFRDGASLVVDGGHWWEVETDGGTTKVMRTAEMKAWLREGGARRRLTVPMVEPLQTVQRALAIDPYTLGAWLGNGNCRNAEIYVRECWAKQTLQLVQHAYPEARITRPTHSPECVVLSLAGTGFYAALRDQGLLSLPGEPAKHVPAKYLTAGHGDRLALLRGLMDTDGYVNEAGTCVFTSTTEALADGVQFLARSLGMRATKRETNDAREGKRGRHATCWKVTFRASRQELPFAARNPDVPEQVQRGRVQVTSIKRVRSRPVQCIEVEAGDQLFCAGESLTLTHNCWKASSSILNALLRLFNERAYDNGSAGRIACPIETVVGASNEMPESKELDALYDRFLLRFVTDRIHDRGAMKQMLGGDAAPQVTARLTLDELHELQEAVELVTLPDAVLDLVLDVKEELAKAGFTSSDRRWKKALKLLKASALLRGRDECTDDDLLVLADVLWTDPKDRHELRQLVTKAANPALHAAQALLDAAREVYQTLPLNQGSVSEAEMGSVFTKVAEANGQFKRTIEKLNKLVAGRTSEAISEAIAQVREMSQESTRFAARLSGIDVA